ncbi:MAG: MCE family protein [Rhodococcus sp. (in: high G+C Gram-positive bacteria)]|uniref:MCE family protein n=1 Tax=Rhodococcus sp. TaxID=1831 RepID=UPI003BAEE071
MTKTTRAAALKFGVFAMVMLLVTFGLVVVFGQFRAGATANYTAVFTNVSGLRKGDTVRIAGIRVGTVNDVTLGDDHLAYVTFDADRTSTLTQGSRATVRYLNLVGDRFLELLDGPGNPEPLAAGSEIPVDRTAPALDLDLLIGGFKPLIRALDPAESNKLTASLVQVLQGQGGTLVSLLSNTSSFTSALADKDQLIGQVIENLKTVLGTISAKGDQFSAAIDRLEHLVSGLAQQSDPIGDAITSIDTGTATVADLLTETRGPLHATLDNLAAVAPTLDSEKGPIEAVLQRAPGNYRKLARLGIYGSFFQFYLCGVAVKVDGVDGGPPITLPWIAQTEGRCADE